MSLEISRIVKALEPSATLAMAAKAKELKAAGKKVYDFSVGEPDFTTPEHICQAASEAMRAGHTHYTPASGIPELRAAIAKQYEARHGLKYTPAQVVVSNGAKHSLHNVFTALCNPGDEVIIPAPYWVSYAELVKLTGAKPVIVETARPRISSCRRPNFARPSRRARRSCLLCSPSNPTGSMYSPEELGTLADVVIERNLLVVSDEIYERLIYGGRKFASFATVRPGLAERTIMVNGVSKAYAMTGWRIGWTLVPRGRGHGDGRLAKPGNVEPVQRQPVRGAGGAGRRRSSASSRCWPSLPSGANMSAERIGRIAGLSCPDMGGAFYAFINIRKYLGRNYGGARVDNSTQWCLTLLEQQNVATVMGSAFGAEGYVRVSFATSLDELAGGFDRIEAFLAAANP